MKIRGRLIALAAAVVATACLLVLLPTGEPDGKTPPTADGSGPPLVVSLSPNATEMVFALGCGELLAGRSSACDFPPEALQAPVVGGFGTPSLDLIASLRPRYVLSTLSKDRAFRENLARFGIEYVELPLARLSDYEAGVLKLGDLLGCPERAEAEAARFRGLVEPVREKSAALAAAGRPRVYLEVWHRPLRTCGSSSYVGDLIEYAGGKNIGSVREQDYWGCSDEWVIHENPELIICPSMGPDAPAEVARRPGWEVISAVKNGRVHSSVDPNLVFRLGPRTPEAVVILHRLIWPSAADEAAENETEGAGR